MPISILSIDPVGTVVPSDAINAYVTQLKADWDAAKIEVNKTGKITMVHVTEYLLDTLDGLINCANVVLTAAQGADKKATVLAAVGIIYDYIVVQAFPLWLKPFSGQIKNFILNTVISISIDWIVSKYNNGTWTPPVVTVPPTTPPVTPPPTTTPPASN